MPHAFVDKDFFAFVAIDADRIGRADGRDDFALGHTWCDLADVEIVERAVHHGLAAGEYEYARNCEQDFEGFHGCIYSTAKGTFLMRKKIGINERGLRVGEDHQNAKLTDAEVELIRKLHSEGLSYKTLAVKFEVSKSLIRYIVQFKRRGQVATNWRSVHIPD